MTEIYLQGVDADATFAALQGDVSDPVAAMKGAGCDVSTFFEYGTWDGVDFTRSDLTGVSFRGADLRGAIFTKKQLAQLAKNEPRTFPSIDYGTEHNSTASERPNDIEEQEAFTKLPNNIEAEQSLLGAILSDNNIYDRVASIVSGKHFYDPVHAKIFELAASRIAKNAVASPVTLKHFLEDDAGLAELGGYRYLSKLTSLASSSFAAKDYAQSVYDLAMRRELIRQADAMKELAQNVLDGQDPVDQIRLAEQQLYVLGEAGRNDQGYSSFLTAVTDAVNQANAAYQRDTGMYGIETGIQGVDKRLGGLHRSDLIVLGGRPSMGKSALATSIAFNIAEKYKQGQRPDGSTGPISGGVVGYCSIDLGAGQMANRVLASAASIPSWMILNGDLTEDEFRRYVTAAKALEAVPLFIDDTPAITIAEIATRARRIKRTHGLDLLIVDPLQHVRSKENSDIDNQRDFSGIARDLKGLARELDIPVLALSEVASSADEREDKRPQLSDLREYGVIERHADVILFLFREEYYHEIAMPMKDSARYPDWLEKLDQLKGLAQVVIAKNRHGPIGTFELRFDSRFSRFHDDRRQNDELMEKRYRSDIPWEEESSEVRADRSNQDDEIPF